MGMKKLILIIASLFTVGGIIFTAWSIYQAMEVYPGGTILNRSSDGYDWWNNYLSDLGRLNAWNRTANHLSNESFNQGLYVAIVCMLLLFNMYNLIAARKRNKLLAFSIGLLSFGSALAYLGIVWFPLDVNYRLHTIFVRVGFISFWILSMVLASFIRNQSDFPNFYAWVMYAFAAAFLSSSQTKTKMDG